MMTYRKVWAWLCCVLCSGSAVLAGDEAPDSPYDVGVAQVDITPEIIGEMVGNIDAGIAAAVDHFGLA